jgi:hypothetical protein
MSDVTGNFGGESIRLRGMALEDTQYRIFEKLDDFLEAYNKVNQSKLQKANEDNKAKQRANKALGDVADAADDSNSTLSKFTNTTKILNKATSILSETLGATVRTVRGMGDNIDDASYSIRGVSQNLRGTAGEIARFAADSVNQLQDQYRAFKQISDISGIMSSGFSDLRTTSAQMGLTMDQYAGLMQENFINLRSGGNLVANSMKRLQAGVDELNKDTSLQFIFQRLGIQANDYAKIILQQTALNRGLNRGLETYSEGFSQAMLKSVTSAIGLADAFGVQRSQMLDGQRKAQEDAMFARYYDSLQVDPKIKDASFKMAMAATGNDVEKAKQLAISFMTDGNVITPIYRELLASGGDEVISALKQGAAKLAADGVEALPEILNTIRPALENYAKQFGDATDLARFFIGIDTPLREGTTALLDLVRKVASPKEGLGALQNAVNKGQAAAEGGYKDQIDSLGMLQRENIKTAVLATQANKALNSFGLTLAHSTQILSSMLVAVAKGSAGTIINDPEVKKLISQLDTFSNQGVQFMINEAEQMITAQTEKALAGIKEGINQTNNRSSSESNTRTSAANPESIGGSIMSRMVTVKTGSSGQEQQIPVGQIDSVKGQHNQGGPTSPAIKSLLGVLAGSGNIRVTGINDAYSRRSPNSAHREGRAVDFTLPAGNYAEKRNEIIDQLTRSYGLTLGKDFNVFDEANMPFGHTSGAHLHVEFSKEGAAKFQNKFQNMFQNMQGATGPGATSGAGSTPTAPRSSPNQQNQSSETMQTGSIDSTVSTALSSPSSSVNNSTSNMVAIADSNLLDKLDSVRSELINVNNSIGRLSSSLAASTFG